MIKQILKLSAFLGILLLPHLLWAQTDTLRSKILGEVTIQGAENNKQFNFYQSSKLASTEEILSKMEGVNLIRRGAYGMEPTLRNYSANQINLSIDGMRIYGACTDKMDPVSIYVEPINLQGITANQGAQGNFTGSSIGGNINLKFKAPATLCHKQELTQVIQSYNTNNQAISTSFAYEKSGPLNGLRLSGTYRKANDYNAPDSLIKHSGYEKINFAISFQQVIDSSNQIRINYLGDLGRNIGYPALPMDVGTANAHIFSLSHLYKSKLEDGLTSETKIYYNTIFHQMDDTHRETIAMHMDMPSWSKTMGFYNEASFKLRKQKLLTRIDAHHNTLRGDMTMYPNNGNPKMYMQSMPENTIKNIGFAFQYQIDLRYNYFMKWNGRIDYFKQQALLGVGSDQWNGMGFNINEIRANAIKSLSWIHGLLMKKGMSQTLIMAYGERLPSSNERYGFYLFNPMDNYDYLGNPDINTEKSVQVEYILKQDLKAFQWSVQPFYHHTLDYIYTYIKDPNDYYPMTIGAKGVKTYKNISYANSMGAEASFSFKINSNWIYKSNLKYIYTETSDGKALPWVAPFKIQQALRSTIGGIQYQLEHTFATAQNRINTDFGERKSPAFQLWNLRASKSFTKKKQTFQFAIAIENILNTSYHEHLDIGYIPRMGRNFNFTFGYILR